MAINTQKFLPSAKIGGALIKSSQKVISTKKSSSVVLTEKSVQDIANIKVSTIRVENILKGTLAAEKKKLDEKKRKESGKRREKQEEKLETKPNAEKGTIKMPKLPRLGIFDWIKNFIGNIILGYFAVKLIDHLPKIIPIVKFLGSAADFLINVGGKLLNGLITFVDWGYKAIDATRGFIKNMGGENFAQIFDKFIGAVDTTLFLTSVLAADLALEAMTGSGSSGLDRPTKPVGPRRGPVARLGRKTFVSALGKGGAKTALKTVRPLLKRLPIIGALLDFGLSVALGEDPGRAAFKAIGAGLLGSVGAAIGSVVPIAGNIVGGVVGGVVGDAIGGALYDMFFGGKKPTPKGKVQGKAGGGITRGGKTAGGVKRTVKKQKYKRVVRKVSKQPGKVEIKSDTDVGQKEKVFDLFGFVKTAVNAVNPFNAIKKSGEELGKTDYFGPILALTSKLTLGQQPTQQDYQNVGLGLNLLLAKGIQEKQLKGGLVAAFAEGGMVDPDVLSAVETGGDISNWVAKTFQGEIESNAQKTLRIIRENAERRNLMERGVDKSITPEGTPLGEGETASGRALMQGLIQRGFTKEEAAAIVGNLWAESGFRTTATNPTSGAFGLMQWLGGRKSRLYSYAAEKGKQVTDKELQLDYIKWELKGGNAYETNQFKKAMSYGTDVASKTKGFAEQVERAEAGELSSSMSKRIGAAESVYGGRMVAGEKPSGLSIELGKGYGSEGSKIAGELGRFMKKKGVVPGSIHRHPEHPPFSFSSGHSRGSLHYQGRAIDLGGYANEQGPILAAVAEFNRLKGVKPVQLLHAGNEPSGHSDHVHVAYLKGGRVRKPTFATLAEDGRPEFVFDADTTAGLDRLAPGILEKLNVAKTKPQIASILQSYTTYEQAYAEPEIIEVPVPVPVPLGNGYPSSSGGMIMKMGGGGDPFETLYNGSL